MLELSVIICTHNPDFSRIMRTVDALKAQTICPQIWELLIIDNASSNDWLQKVGFEWHPRVRVVFEEVLGIGFARERGILESTSPLILFVDDDNILAPNYIENVLQIDREFPWIGTWGGSIEPIFDCTPEEWTVPFWRMLAIRSVLVDQWSNVLHQHDTTPVTAGMAVRRSVALRYIVKRQQDSRRRVLGRTGKDGFLGCEDTDLAFTACELGLGMGVFARLNLTHLIPKSRLEERYLLRLWEGTAASLIILDALWGKATAFPDESLVQRFRSAGRRLLMSPRQRRFAAAAARGRAQAKAVIASWNSESASA